MSPSTAGSKQLKHASDELLPLGGSRTIGRHGGAGPRLPAPEALWGDVRLHLVPDMPK
jgi:hypothetical protein